MDNCYKLTFYLLALVFDCSVKLRSISLLVYLIRFTFYLIHLLIVIVVTQLFDSFLCRSLFGCELLRFEGIFVVIDPFYQPTPGFSRLKQYFYRLFYQQGFQLHSTKLCYLCHYFANLPTEVYFLQLEHPNFLIGNCSNLKVFIIPHSMN